MDELARLDPVHFTPVDGEPPYLWYSLVTMAPMTGAGELYGPEAPLVTGECTGAESLCSGHQWLSKASSALRGSVCETASFDAYFDGIALDLQDRTADPCRFPLGEGIDPAGIGLRVSPVGAEPRELELVDDLDACTSEGQFHMEGAQLRLCPLACDRLLTDTNPTVELFSTCD